jgi:hypothetical protein
MLAGHVRVDARRFRRLVRGRCNRVVSRSILGRRPSKVQPRDGRSAEGVFLRRTRAELTQHVGGHPTAPQRALIDRVAILTLHVARMDTAAIAAGGFSDHASREYLDWSNALTGTLAQLGPQAAQAPTPSLSGADWILGRGVAA